MVVYDGTGEGALSGDSYFGNGILKSTDGGITWKHVSGDYFARRVDLASRRRPQQRQPPLRGGPARPRRRAPRLAPDPLDVRHVGVARRRRHLDADQGSTRRSPWARPTSGSTLRTRNTSTPSFWSDKIYKSTDGGATWNPIMNGLPTGQLRGGPDALQHRPSLTRSARHIAVLYTGFD